MHIVEIIGYCPHLHHTLSIIGCQSLYLRSATICQYSDMKTFRRHFLPILKPYLHLSRAQTWDFSRKSFSVGCIWMSLLRELTHQETGLLVS